MAKPDYTLIDYVRWMGNLSFEDYPFCDADALVLCDVIYFEIFDEESSIGKTLRELINAAPVDDHLIVKCLGNGTKEHSEFIRQVAASSRYGTITLNKYSEKLDLENAVQFAAAAFFCPGQFNFAAFRGTDDTIASWKEDFMISFTRTAAQEMARDFAAEVMMPGISNYIGGHSKGGNLALYAAAELPSEIRGLLTHVYDLDGPGFCGDVYDLNKLNVIRDITTFIIPEFDIVGKLFEPDIPDKKIVLSSENGVMQHELLSWGVRGDGLDIVTENDPRATKINGLIDDWVENISQEDRRVIVSELFNALESDGAKTMTDIMKSGLDGFEKILYEAGISSKVTKKAAIALPEQAFFGNIPRNIREKGILKYIAGNDAVRALLMIVMGILFIFSSENIINLIAVIFAVSLTGMQIWLTGRRLKENHWKFEMVRERLHLCVIMASLCICMCFKEQASFLLGIVIFGIAALLISVQSGLKSNDKNLPIYRRIFSGFECAAGIIYGMSILLISETTVFGFISSIGIGLITDSVIRLLFEIFEAHQRSRIGNTAKK